MKRKLVTLFTVLILLFTTLPTMTISAASWWDTDWLYRQNLTFDNSASTVNLTDFPVVIFLDNSNFNFSLAQPNGDDVRFIDSDGATELDYEIVSWNYTNDSINNDSAEIWVEVPQVDGMSNTDYITMYWGNSTATNGEDVSGTWNSGYAAVYHLNDITTSTISDSTSNANNGTKKAANEPIETAGLIGKAQQFDGSNDYIRVPNSSSLNITEEITIESYVKSYYGWKLILDKQRGESYAIGLSGDGGNKFRFESRLGGEYVAFDSDENINDGNWHYLVATYTQTGTPTLTLYIDGVAVKSTTYYSGDIGSTTNDLIIGAGYNLDANLYGIIDEVYISSVCRSSDWIKAMKLNLENTYTSFGTVQGKPQLLTFTSTISGNNVTLDWTANYATSYKIIRGEVYAPTSLTDGLEVYSGTDLTYTDYGAANEIDTYYYSIWAISDWGTSTNYLSTTGGGNLSNIILLGILLFAAIVMSIASFVTHRGSIAFASTLLWLIVTIWNFSQAAGEWNIYMILGFVGTVMMLVMPIEAMFLNKGEEAAEDELEKKSAMQQALDEMDEKNKSIREKRYGDLL